MKPTVSVWTTSQLDYDQRIQRVINTIESMGATVSIWDRRTTDYPQGTIKSRWLKGPGMYLDYNRQIARLVNQSSSDLIYAADIDVMPGLMYGLRRRREIPVLLDLHEWFPEVIELSGKPLKKRVWQRVEQRSVKFATTHITVNRSLAKIFENKYGKKFTVVRNVPELNQIPYASAKDRLSNKILYYQGAMNEGRGLMTAIETLRYLPGWQLWFVGEGDVMNEVRKKVEAENMKDRVIFYGRRHPGQLHGLAGQATIGLNLLDGHSRSYLYSLANKYFDYIHAGLPSIHMDFPEYQILMEEYHVGALIRDIGAEKVAGIIQEMTDDYTMYSRIVDRCEAAKLSYNWERESRALVEKLNPYLS